LAISPEAFTFQKPVVSKMARSGKYRGLKIAGIVLFSLLVIGGGILLYLTLHYKHIVFARLPVIAAKATDSLYRITAENFSINIYRRSFSLHGVHMRPDSSVLSRMQREGRGPHVLLDITVPEIEISGLHWRDVRKGKQVICESVGIFRPDIRITITNNPPDKDTVSKEPAVGRIFAAHIRIVDPSIRYKNGEAQDAFCVRSSGGTITAADWDFRPGMPYDTSRFFYSGSADVRLEMIVYHKPGSGYHFGLNILHFQSLAHQLTMEGVYVKPLVTKKTFYQVEKQQKEVYEGSFPLIRLNKFNWEAFISRQYINAGSIDINDADLEIYLSRLAPPSLKSRMGNYPHQLLQKLTLPLNIPLISLNDGRFRYKELNEKTHRVGTLDFSQIDGYIDHVTNLPEEIALHPSCHINLHGKFMHKSDMKVQFDLPLATKTGDFSVEGSLGELEAGQITDAAKALAMAEIKSLKLHELLFSIKGNDTAADGKVSIRYNDLRVKIQKVEETTKEMRSRGVLSLLANELLLYNDNPMDGEPLRIATTHVRRDSTKSFFNLIWRNLYEAGGQTGIRQEGMADLVRKSNAKKGKEKVRFFKELFPKRKKKAAVLKNDL
jgi:hypothetical protein